MDFQQAKFDVLVQYISYRADREDLGAVKLNKILWYSDVLAYVKTGRSITGESYCKQRLGPVSRHILPSLDRLGREGRVVTRRTSRFDYPKTEYIALVEPDLSCFSAEEIATVDYVIDKICREHTARSISEHSHDSAWQIAENGEEIPYHAVLASREGEVTAADIKWAYQQIAA